MGRGIVPLGYQWRSLNASSRQRGFSKNILRDGLVAAGIDYEHCKDLGSPKEVRPVFHRGDIAGALTIYGDKVLGTTSGTAALSALAADVRTKRVAILCLEQDEGICHRQAVIIAVTKLTRTTTTRL